MLPLTLAARVLVRDGSLAIGVDVDPGEIVPGLGMTMVLEVKNEGTAPVRVPRLFLRGSQGTLPHVDAASYTAVYLKPGEKTRREFRSAVTSAAGMGSLVVTGGVEREDGTAVAALASFDRVEPYQVALEIEGATVAAGRDQARKALVTLSSRAVQPALADVTLQVPRGWRIEGGDVRRRVRIPDAGQRTGFYFDLLVPAGTAPGEYPVRVDVRAAGRAYTATHTVLVTRAVSSQ